MPTYEYRCRDCGHSFDIVQKMSDDPLTHCPECGGDLRKVFAPPAISFKGSGFYATDHRKKATSSADGKSTDGKEGTDTKKDSTGSTSTSGSGDTKKSDSSTSNATTKEGPS
jgi:putative FmdB family regulatory protein